MIRLVASSAAIVALALAASLTTAFWLNRLGGPGEAQAAVAVSAAPAAATGSPSQVVKGRDGHYWADADIEGRAVRLMIDTGATVVALTPDDAVRLGLRLTARDYVSKVITASGPAAAAPVTLKSVSVAGARVDQVEALVVQDGLPHSLLGMSYLGRLSAFEATPNGLTLRP